LRRTPALVRIQPRVVFFFGLQVTVSGEKSNHHPVPTKKSAKPKHTWFANIQFLSYKQKQTAIMATVAGLQNQ